MAKSPKETPGTASALPVDDGRRDYVVTSRAPSRVALRRVQPGDPIRLTEEEARSELLARHIEPAPETTVEAASKSV